MRSRLHNSEFRKPSRSGVFPAYCGMRNARRSPSLLLSEQVRRGPVIFVAPRHECRVSDDQRIDAFGCPKSIDAAEQRSWHLRSRQALDHPNSKPEISTAIRHADGSVHNAQNR